MPIRTGKHEDLGALRGYVQVDLSDSKHKNRVMTFLKRKHPLTGRMYYEINAQWTKRLHPTLHLTKGELRELASALMTLAGKKRK